MRKPGERVSPVFASLDKGGHALLLDPISNALATMMTYETMMGLAPAHLPVYVDLRYDGGGQSALLAEFTAGDAQRLRTLYQAVSGLYDTLKSLASDPVPAPSAAANLKHRPECETAMQAARALGSGTKLPPHLGAILHDVRGGSLLALLASLEILPAGPTTSDVFLRIFCYARDHLKIMRNGVPDIDPSATARDREPSPHGIRLLREKWLAGQFSIGAQVKSVRFESLFEGPIASRCMEFSALDRIIYNLMNNAARHGDGPEIALNIFAPSEGAGAAIRFVVQNEVTELQCLKIGALVPAGLGKLFLGGLTTGGNGMGLRICTDFVVRAFGLKSPEQAIAEHYIGAQLVDRTFAVWFHWPRV